MSDIISASTFNPLQPESDTNKSSGLLEIVAIGASAGGLEALQRWFDNMPNDTGAAFVVIQHLSPDYKSIMDKLLERHTSMPIRVVNDPMFIESNTIYLMSPGKEMTLESKRLMPLQRNSRERIHLPINSFLRSLANQSSFRSVAVILSGSGSDGSLGIKAIHEHGGLVMVQTPEDSQFNGMPVNAIATGVADLVAPIEELASTLVSYLKYPNMKNSTLMGGTEKDQSLNEIFKLLFDETSIDFSVYKLSTFSRRLENRYKLNQVESSEDYIKLLRDRGSNEMQRLKQDLFIGVTEFFRDHDAYQALREEVIEPMVRQRAAHQSIRVWSIGCSTGEEAYSIAIMFHDVMEQLGKTIDVKIFATDADSKSLNKAMLGAYPESISTEIMEPVLSNHFVRETMGIYRIRKHIRNMVVFANHDILKDPPFSNTDLVTCRNLLIYFQNIGQQKAFNAIRFSLNQDGYLFLGKAETPMSPENTFECVNYRAKLYKKILENTPKPMTSFSQPMQKKLPAVGKKHAPALSYSSSVSHKSSLLVNLSEVLFDRFLPGTFIIHDQDIIHSYGDLSAWMRPHRPGRSQNHVDDLFVASVASYIHSAIDYCKNQKKEILFSDLVEPKHDTYYSIQVMPFQYLDLSEKDTPTYYVVTLKTDLHNNNVVPVKSNDNVQVYVEPDSATQYKIDFLENEVSLLKAQLKASKEQLNSASEQLQTTNEELMASNEELQGTNEELQAVNEELYSLNSEYQQKILELTMATNDIDNFMKSTGIAAIFLDKAYRIRRYTSPFSQYINILPVDVNRSFLDLKLSFSFDNLERYLEHCIVDGTEHTRKINLTKNKIALFKILPYMNSHRQIDGIVLMIDEVKELNNVIQDIGLIRNESDCLYELNDVLGWSYNLNSETLYVANNHYSDTLPLPKYPTLNDLYLLISAEYRSRFIEGIEKTLSTGEEFKLDHTIVLSGGSICYIHSKAMMLADSDGENVKLFGLMQDLTSHKKMEEQALYFEHRFHTVFNTMPIALSLINDQGDYLYVNPAFSELLGYTQKELCAMSYKDITVSDDIALTHGEIEKAKAQQGASKVSVYDKRYIKKDGSVLHIHVKSTLLPESEYRECFALNMIFPTPDPVGIQSKSVV